MGCWIRGYWSWPVALDDKQLQWCNCVRIMVQDVLLLFFLSFFFLFFLNHMINSVQMLKFRQYVLWRHDYHLHQCFQSPQRRCYIILLVIIIPPPWKGNLSLYFGSLSWKLSTPRRPGPFEWWASTVHIHKIACLLSTNSRCRKVKNQTKPNQK